MIHFRADDKGFKMKAENAPILARLNLPIPMFTNAFIKEIIDKYNS